MKQKKHPEIYHYICWLYSKVKISLDKSAFRLVFSGSGSLPSRVLAVVLSTISCLKLKCDTLSFKKYNNYKFWTPYICSHKVLISPAESMKLLVCLIYRRYRNLLGQGCRVQHLLTPQYHGYAAYFIKDSYCNWSNLVQTYVLKGGWLIFFLAELSAFVALILHEFIT